MPSAEALRPITPERIHLLSSPKAKTNCVSVDFCLDGATLRADIFYSTIRLTALDARLAFNANCEERTAHTVHREDIFGSIGRVPPSDITASDDSVRAALASAFDHAIGAEALIRHGLVRGAVSIVAEHHALSEPYYDVLKSRIVETSNTSGARHVPLKAAGFHPSTFLARVHFVAGELHPIQTVKLREGPFSAHERLDLIDAAMEGFAARGIDIRAWWFALDVKI